MRTQLRTNERGAALLETAITIPLILLVAVGIFEFGKAYQTSQVLVNAAREGARQAILADKTDTDVIAVVEKYMSDGGLPCVGGSAPADLCSGSAVVTLDRNVPLGTSSASKIDIDYPFKFMVINPIARMIAPASKTGNAITMKSTALMRNEG